MTEYGRAGAERNARAILLNYDTEGTQVQFLGAPGRCAYDVARRGGVIRDDARQVEFEVGVARIDDLDGWNDTIDRR